MHAPSASKEKYHLCVCFGDAVDVQQFLFINSNGGFDGDLVLANGDFQCIPPNDTGLSVVSCSIVIRLKVATMKLYGATKQGQISVGVAAKIREHIVGCRSMTQKDRVRIIGALDSFIAS